MEQIFAELRQLASTVQRGVVDQVRHVGLQVAVLLGVQIQHELGQRAVHAGDLPFHHHEARTGQLNRGGKIQPAGHFTQIDVIAHREVVLARFAPAGHFQVFAVVFTIRHGVVRQVRQRQGVIADLALQRIQRRLGGIQLVTQLVHFATQRLDVFPTRFGRADGFRSGVAFRLQRFSFYLQNFAAFFLRTQQIQIEFKASASQFDGDCV